MHKHLQQCRGKLQTFQGIFSRVNFSCQFLNFPEFRVKEEWCCFGLDDE